MVKITDDRKMAEETVLFLQKFVSSSEHALGPRVRLHLIAEVDNNYILPVYSLTLLFSFSELIGNFNEGFRLAREAQKEARTRAEGGHVTAANYSIFA